MKQLIGSALPETLFIKIRNETCASAIWDALANEFENRSHIVAIELRRKLQEQRCGEKGDVRAHFDKMIILREELASLGHSINPDDFAAMLISSVPTSYDSTISAMTTSTKITHLDLTPDVIMTTLIDDYDRRQSKSGKKSTSSGEDAAYSASSSRKFSGNCHNCQKKGHKAEDCWEEGGGKAGQRPKRKWKGHAKGKSKDLKDKAGTADAEGREPDGVWFAHAAGSDDEDDWLREVDEADLQGICAETDEDEEPRSSYNSALLAGENLQTGQHMILFDSGASRHMSSYRDHFSNFKSIVPKAITAADKHTFEAIGKGDLTILIPNGPSTTRILLRNVLYVLKMGITLVSIGKLDVASYAALFRDKRCQIFDSRKKRLGEIPLTSGLYSLRSNQAAGKLFAGVAKHGEPLTMQEVHERLGHVAPDSIRQMIKDGTITGITLDEAHESMGTCDSCEYAKLTRKPIGKLRDPLRQSKLGDEVHTDLWGPSPVQTGGHSRYYASFTDDYTRYTKLYLQKAKSNTFDSYQAFEGWLATQFNTKVKRLCSDCGGEYLSAEFTKHLKLKGTERRVTMHDTPEHNGVAERLNRTLIERVRAMMHASSLPKSLWGEAVMHATWVKNHTSTRRLGKKTPYEMLYHTKPNLENVPAWGCQVKVHDMTGTKLDMRACDGHWVGFDPESGGHRIYFPDRGIIGVERSVAFEQRE